LGTCLERQGFVEAAIERYDEALSLLMGAPPTATVDAVAGKARCYQMMGDNRYAAYLLEGALHSLSEEALFDPSALLRIQAALVPVYFDTGLYERAAEAARQALSLAPKVSDPFRLATMHLNVAQIHLHAKRFSEAKENLLKAEQLFGALDLQSEVAMAYLALGYVFVRDNKPRKARSALSQARDHFHSIQDRLNEARVLNELARLERLQGQPERARGEAEQALALIEDDDLRERALAHRELALSQLESDPKSAEKNLHIAIELFERGEQPVEVAVTCRALGDVLQSTGSSRRACEAYRDGLLALEERT
jgi:tetratricopeptide (TPR) repeat protein